MKYKAYVILGMAALGLLAVWLLWLDVPTNKAAQTSEVPASRVDSAASEFGSLFGGLGKSASSGGSTSVPKDKQLANAYLRYEMAERKYNTYRDLSRYPFTSRPIEQNLDVSYPFETKTFESALVTSKGARNGFRVLVGMDRVSLSGSDSVKFTLSVLDNEGRVLPLTISNAIAKQVLPRKDALRYDKQQLVALRTTNLTFTDSGLLTGVDDVANDNVYSVRFTPQKQGFEGFSGRIHTVVSFKADGVDSFAYFQVSYTDDQIYATWLGSVREVQENGSLNFYLKAQIAVPGHYIATARLDDASGKSFALLTFNDEVKAGEQEFKMHLFGALIHDKKPAFPLKLRDVEAYYLHPNTSPPKRMMAPRKGLVYTSGKYLLESFSPAEWTSEQRTRYLTEYKRNLEDAKEELEALTSAN